MRKQQCKEYVIGELAMILGKSLIMKSRPHEFGNSKKRIMHSGVCVVIGHDTREKNNWINIITYNGSIGWLHINDIVMNRKSTTINLPKSF